MELLRKGRSFGGLFLIKGKVMNQSERFIVGLDIGYSNVKVACGGTQLLDPKVTIFPAYATPEPESDLALAKKSPDEVKVYPNGTEWRVFTNRVGHRELHESYHSTEMYKALFYGALIKATEGRSDVIDILVTGLPVRIANSEADRSQLCESFTGKHEVTPGRFILVKEVVVLSQGVGIMNDILNTEGLISDEDLEFSNILVIDPGYYSMDYVTFHRGDKKNEFSGSSLNATSVIIEEIVRVLERDYPKEGAQEAERIETALRLGNKTFNNGFRSVEIEPLIEEVSHRIVSSVVAELLKRTRSIGPVHIIISAGGGARFYDHFIKEAFPQARILQSVNPVASNSIGYWHYGVNKLSSQSD
ncbi:rod shape-determining protein MreD [Proteus vulgaris]|uniref:ParM/StbA family protein n=1 Tax=Providencia rettgeri TaxID=587 RepID=A0AAW6UNA8_PRORE|nr:ParM/StbA family protein [Providencia rettgeri]MDI9095098.1 ParM/StbA family protein [Providencia rettgeri]